MIETLEVTTMPIAYLEPQRAGGEVIETTPTAEQEAGLLPAATMSLVPFATDEVEWQQLDEYPLAY